MEVVKSTYRKQQEMLFPGLPDFIEYVIDEYLEPTWAAVDTLSSCNYLAGICSFPLLRLPPKWHSQACPPGSSYLVRDVSGVWAVTDGVKFLTDEGGLLGSLLQKVNLWIGRCHTSNLLFGSDGLCYLVEHDFANDSVLVYSFHETLSKFVLSSTFEGLPPGAFHCYSIHDCEMIVSVGQRIMRCNLSTCTAEVIAFKEDDNLPLDPIIKRCSFPNPPMSTQTVFCTNAHIIYINKSVVKVLSPDEHGSCPPISRTMICSQPGVNYIALSGDNNTCVVIGYDGISNEYLFTLIDLKGLFVISTTRCCIHNNLAPISLSIVSMSVAKSNRVVLSGKSGRINGGSYFFSFDPIYL